MLFIVLLILPKAPLRAQGLVRIRENVPKPTVRLSLIGAVVLIGVAAILSPCSTPRACCRGARLRLRADHAVAGAAHRVRRSDLARADGVRRSGRGGHGRVGRQRQPARPRCASFCRPRRRARRPAGAAASRHLPGAVHVRVRGLHGQVVFTQDKVFPSGSRSVDRLRLGPIHFRAIAPYMVLLAVVFAIVGLGRVVPARPVRSRLAGHEGQSGGVRHPRA